MRSTKKQKPRAQWSSTPAARRRRGTLQSKEFSARYPGVTVSVTGGFSNVLDKKIDAQLASNKMEMDIAVFQTLQDFARWKQQAALLEFKPQGFDKIDPSFKDPGRRLRRRPDQCATPTPTIPI